MNSIKKFGIEGKNIIAQKAVNNKTTAVIYLLVFMLAAIFGIILEKNISIPQSVLRIMGAMAIALLFYWSFSKPSIPFIIFTAYLPFSRNLTGDFGTGATALNLTNVFLLIIILGLIMRSASDKDKLFEKASLNLPITLFIMWGICSLIKGYLTYGSIYFENFIIPLKRWLTPMVLYFISLSVAKNKDIAKNIIITMMIVTVIIGLMAVRDYMNISGASSLEDSRIGGVFDQPNTLSGFFVYNMFLFVGFLLIYFPAFRYLFMIIPFLICFRGIQVTFSRGGYLGCAFGGLAIAFFRSKILFILVMSLAVVMILNPVLLPEGIRNRMSSTFSDEKVLTIDIEDVKDPSAQGRIDIWRGAIEMIKDYPVFGVGYGLFPKIIPMYVPVGNRDAHNTYLILAAEMGIPALIIFLIILLIMIRNSYWLYRQCNDKFIKAFALGLLGGLFGLLMVNMFGSRLNSEEVSAYFWIYAGLIMAAVRMKQKGVVV